MQSNTRCPSPPPRMPSPQLLPTPLPSPPLHHQQSRPRLNGLSSQPKPPSPLGQPVAPGSPVRPQLNLHAPRAQAPPPLDLSLWLDGDDFGARRARSYSPSSPCTPPEGRTQHDQRGRLTPIFTTHPHPHPRSRTRPRSPPPSPGRPVTPPPVPPIPTHFLGVSSGKPVFQPRSTNLTPTDRFLDLPPQSHAPLLRKARSTNAITCIHFVTAVHDGQ
ncbi:hypothetical protein DFH94DRAFT_716846 [Russula ochroleuca]|jgi:hypothetical protein|uniref:Uncharacterized protein n=1 Tax=Russula ochroleuca TaxID=152965 RepID=A0A9P5N2V7_9AGAM|nr:hypothetical protein DFH94DRAFT_716846 [Russula ochroleuca]